MGGHAGKSHILSKTLISSPTHHPFYLASGSLSAFAVASADDVSRRAPSGLKLTANTAAACTAAFPGNLYSGSGFVTGPLSTLYYRIIRTCSAPRDIGGLYPGFTDLGRGAPLPKGSLGNTFPYPEDFTVR